MNSTMITVRQVIDTTQQYWNDQITRSNLNETFTSYLNNPKEYRVKHSKTLCSELIKILFSTDEVKDYYYMMSALFCMTLISDVFYEIIVSCISDKTLTKETKFFIYYQCISYSFLYPEAGTKQAIDLLDDFHAEIFSQYSKDVSDLYGWIPINERNNNLIIMFTSQVLGVEHGPTKILYDRCYTIVTKTKKEVLIINTADELTQFGITDWFNMRLGNYIDDLSSINAIDYIDARFAFFQCPNEMPQVRIIREIMTIVKEERPLCIVSIGTNLTAELCSQIVPVLTIPLGFTESSFSTFQQIPSDISEAQRAWLIKHSFNDNHFIKANYTYNLKVQTKSYSRTDLNLPEKATICIIIGYRLDYEIDDDFMDVILQLAEHNIYSIFIGKFNYNNKISKSKLLENFTFYLGLQSETMAISECCDIYLNPKRLGGGTSATEALYKGVPVVTLNYGDVATIAGNDFCVDNYEEMINRTLKLARDENYYNKMKKLAKERANMLTDTDGEFARVLSEISSRPEFK